MNEDRQCLNCKSFTALSANPSPNRMLCIDCFKNNNSIRN